MIHHVAVQHRLAREIEEPGAERDAAVARHRHRVVPDRDVQSLAVDLGQLERVGVDVEDVIAAVVVDHRPLLDRAEADPLIDSIDVKDPAVDEEGKFLVIAGRRVLRLDRP